jgi:hypothetical protein
MVRNLASLATCALAISCGGDGGTTSGDQRPAIAPELRETARPTATATTETPSQESPGDTDGAPDAAVGTTAEGELPEIAPLRTGRAIWARPISLRSMSLKLRLKSGGFAVFKPLRKGDGTARHEVAFYRLARALGVGRVPPSTMRSMPLERLERLLADEHAATAEQLAEIARLDERRWVTGAMIDWVDGLQPMPLGVPSGRPRLTRMLALDGPAPDRKPLVPALSALVSFDYAMGNWDRFTGGNLFLDEGGTELVLIDNNAAFDRWSEGQEARMQRLLDSCERFSRRLVGRLRSLDAAEIERALARDPSHREHPLLTSGEIDRILERRDRLIAHVDALSERHGERRVLAFP